MTRALRTLIEMADLAFRMGLAVTQTALLHLDDHAIADGARIDADWVRAFSAEVVEAFESAESFDEFFDEF